MGPLGGSMVCAAGSGGVGSAFRCALDGSFSKLRSLLGSLL